jgi:hypothetical protein
VTLPCQHGFPTAANCWECMYEGNLDPPTPQPVRASRYGIEARYDGRCLTCDEPIHVGQAIALMTNGTYRHEWCTEDES